MSAPGASEAPTFDLALIDEMVGKVRSLSFSPERFSALHTIRADGMLYVYDSWGALVVAMADKEWMRLAEETRP